MHTGSLTGSTLTINQGDAAVYAATATTSKVSIAAGGPHLFAGNFGATPFTISGASSATLTGTFSGTIAVATSTVKFAASTVSSTITVASGSVEFSSSNVGGGQVTVQAGSATFRNSSTVAGKLSVTGGTLNVQSGSTLSGAELDASGGAVTVQSSVSNNLWNLHGSASVSVAGASFTGSVIYVKDSAFVLNAAFTGTTLNASQSATLTLGSAATFTGTNSLACSSATCDIRATGSLSSLIVEGSAVVSGALSTVSSCYHCFI